MINMLAGIRAAPQKMSRSQYGRYRLRLVAFILIWLSTAIALILYWGNCNILLKGGIIVLEYIFAPDFSMIEQVFVSYDRYCKEGLLW